MTLYRNIKISVDLFNLYKKEGIIYFTNLTSASKKNLKHFGDKCGESEIHVTFLIKPLFYSEQKANKFYSGLDISKHSQHKS